MVSGEHEDNGKLRRLLRGLPQVPAGPDFESRLHRRLAKEKPTGIVAALLDRLIHRRIPAIAFSIVTVAVLGVLSYYLYLRPGAEPPAVGVPGPAVKDTGAQNLPAPMQETRSPAVPERKGKAEGKGPVPSGARPGEFPGAKKTVPLDKLEQAKPVEAGAIRQQAEKIRLEAIPDTATSRIAAPVPVKAAAPLPAAARRAAEESGVKSLIHHPVLTDSAARADSLKRDSLERARKTPRPQKPKKQE